MPPVDPPSGKARAFHALRTVWRWMVAVALVVTGVFAAIAVTVLGVIVAVGVGLMRMLPRYRPEPEAQPIALDARRTPQGWIVDPSSVR